MTEPHRGAIRILSETFYGYRRHLAFLVLLGFLSAFLEGVGINAAIPLFSLLLSSAPPTDPISHFIQAGFALVHIPFTLRSVLILMLSLFVLRAVAVVVTSSLRGWITADYLASESQVLVRRTLLMSWELFTTQKSGYLQNTQVRDLQRTGNLLEAVSQTIQSFTGFLIYLAIALTISAPVTLFTFFAGGILLLVLRPFVKRSRLIADELGAEEKQVTQSISEHLSGMKSIKASGVEEALFERIRRPLLALKSLQVRASVVRAVGSSFFQPFSLFFVIIVFSFTYKTSVFNLAVFAATLYLIQKIFVYLESGQGAFHSIGELVPYAENILKFKELTAKQQEPLKPASSAAIEPYHLKSEIAFNDVSLVYGAGKTALENINFNLKRGEMVGITGPSGAGKSSFADLLLRLFTPSKGSISVDGTPLQDISLASWRASIGYMTQEVFLVHGTIEENIRFYRPQITGEDLARAVEAAGLAHFIQGLPDGLRTIVGDRGVTLSGGERQRVGLARVLAPRPSLLILDEATSSLDNASEKIVQEAIQALRGEVTVLVIAHRLSTLMNLDRLLVLTGGRVVEEGTPAELMARKGSYLETHAPR